MLTHRILRIVLQSRSRKLNRMRVLLLVLTTLSISAAQSETIRFDHAIPGKPGRLDSCHDPYRSSATVGNRS